MSDTSTSTSTISAGKAVPAKPMGAYCDWLVGAVKKGGIRSALTTADNPRACDVAYPYLARFWSPSNTYARRRQAALFAHSAVIARTGVKHQRDMTLGKLARAIANRPQGISPDGVDLMVRQMYRTPIATSTRTIESLLRVAKTLNLGIDYQQLYNAYYWWDVGVLKPQSVRRRLLEDYYTVPEKQSVHPTENATLLVLENEMETA